MTLFNYSMDIAHLIDWPQNNTVDIDECLNNIDTTKNVGLLECKQIKMNTNRLNVFNSPFQNKL